MKNSPKPVPMDELSPLITGLIDSGTDVTITVTGNSMRPILSGYRDTVTLTGCDKSKLKKGDLVLYRRPNGQYVLHRIVKADGDVLDMLGDNQEEIEYGIPRENVLCIAKGYTRKNRYHSCGDLSYRVYSFVWMQIVPLRKHILKLYGLLRKGKGPKNET